MPLSRIQLYQGGPVPASATDKGTVGQIAYDSQYQYICTATNYWLRTPIESWDDLHISSVSLLLNFENNFSHAGPTLSNPLTITAAGGITTSTQQVKFGTRSAFFDGVSSRIELYDDIGNVLNFGSGNFTVEAWVYPTAYSRESIASPAEYTADMFIFASANTFFFIANDLASNAGKLAYYSDNNGDGVAMYSPSSARVSKNVWSHVAWTRSGSTLRSFINGTQVATATDSRTYTQSINRIGSIELNTSRFFNGYMDSMRITKGVARYTASFNPPSYDFAKK